MFIKLNKTYALCVLLLAWLHCDGFLSAQEPILLYSPTEDVRNKYPIAVLKLALDKSGIEYTLVEPERLVSFTRIVANQKDKNAATVDVVWALATQELEQSMSTIYIPIDRGLLGWRLLLTHKEHRNKLSNASTNDLKKMRTAMAYDWVDLKILKDHNFNCLSASSYQSLFNLLHTQRVDYLCRSVNEIFRELVVEGKGALAIDQIWAIYYPAPLYFFVNTDKPHLHQAIEKGLKLAMNDGSLKILFEEFFGQVLQEVDLKNRKIIYVENNFLSDKHPFEDESLWFDPEKGF